MSNLGFALYCFLGFLLPVPLIAWLDRPRRRPSDPSKPAGRP